MIRATFAASLSVIRLNLLVELCKRGVHVWSKPEITNAQSEDTQNAPTDEGEIENKEFHLVTFHHLHAEIYRLSFSFLSYKIKGVMEYDKDLINAGIKAGMITSAHLINPANVG